MSFGEKYKFKSQVQFQKELSKHLCRTIFKSEYAKLFAAIGILLQQEM